MTNFTTFYTAIFRELSSEILKNDEQGFAKLCNSGMCLNPFRGHPNILEVSFFVRTCVTVWAAIACVTRVYGIPSHWSHRKIFCWSNDDICLFFLAESDGYNDNGSGVAAVIEVARALVQSGCRLKYVPLKGTLARDFWLLFFFIKSPHSVPWFIP